jgi:predicted alpha/beta-hydrolase family hydrolase
MTTLMIDTRHGPARAHPHPVKHPRAAIVLGHGAGGGVGAPDLVAATRAALAHDVYVVLVEQPYRVAGRRSVAPARQLDAAWLAVVAKLCSRRLKGMPLIAGGRSSGARVACRTAADTGAAAVLCLAFPVHPPGRAGDPSKSRLPELESVTVPTLVIQGANDPFGMPPPGPNRSVVALPGDHSLRASKQVEAAVSDWLPVVLATL